MGTLCLQNGGALESILDDQVIMVLNTFALDIADRPNSRREIAALSLSFQRKCSPRPIYLLTYHSRLCLVEVKAHDTIV
jgi:hypothetical protein